MQQRTMRAYGLERIAKLADRDDGRPGVGMLPPEARAKLVRGAEARRRAKEARLRVVEVLPPRVLSSPARLATSGDAAK